MHCGGEKKKIDYNAFDVNFYQRYQTGDDIKPNPPNHSNNSLCNRYDNTITRQILLEKRKKEFYDNTATTADIKFHCSVYILRIDILFQKFNDNNKTAFCYIR